MQTEYEPEVAEVPQTEPEVVGIEVPPVPLLIKTFNVFLRHFSGPFSEAVLQGESADAVEKAFRAEWPGVYEMTITEATS